MAFRGFERGELALGGGAASGGDDVFGGPEAELVQKDKVGRCEDLRESAMSPFFFPKIANLLLSK